MKFIAVAALFAGALAAPTEIDIRTNNPSGPLCNPGLYSNPVCADVDVLGVACLNSVTPSPAPHNVADFVKICAATGKEARCAVLPILGQAVLCIPPTGGSQ